MFLPTSPGLPHFPKRMMRVWGKIVHPELRVQTGSCSRASVPVSLRACSTSHCSLGLVWGHTAWTHTLSGTQVVSRELKMPMANVHLRGTSTETVPNANVSGGSVVADLNGLAVKVSAARKMGWPVAAEGLGFLLTASFPSLYPAVPWT